MHASKTLAFAALLAAGTAVLAPRHADAAFTLTFTEVAGDVVGVGSGSITTAGLNFFTFTGGATPQLVANRGAVIYGGGPYLLYTGYTGPTAIGGGTFKSPTSFSGLPFDFFASNRILGLSPDYVQGTPYETSVTFAGATFASLGLTPGTYTWEWGSGQTADSLTIQIGPAPAPEPASMALLGVGLLGLGVAKRRRRAA